MKRSYLILFEKYFNGEMSPEERTLFERNVKEDDVLARAYREYEGIIDALRDKETIQLRAKLKEIREEDLKSGREEKFLDGNRNWIWLAAMLTIIIGIAVVVSLLVRDIQREEKIIAEYINNEVDAMADLNKELMKYAMRSHGQVLQSPSDTSGILADGEICFQWTVDSTYNLLMDVVNREGKVVFASHRPIESPYVFTKKMKEGIYVFRFRDDKETFSLTVMYLK